MVLDEVFILASIEFSMAFWRLSGDFPMTCSEYLFIHYFLLFIVIPRKVIIGHCDFVGFS